MLGSGIYHGVLQLTIYLHKHASFFFADTLDAAIVNNFYVVNYLPAVFVPMVALRTGPMSSGR